MTVRRKVGWAVAMGEVAIAVSVVACATDDAILAPEQGGGLVGVWQTVREPMRPQGSMQGTWTVTSDGRIEQRIVMYGIYPREGPDDVSAETRNFGRIGATATAFVVRTDSIVTHDAFYGPSHRDVQRPAATVVNAPRDSTHYRIEGNALLLTYYSYPADAPVLTHGTMFRVR